MVRTSQAGYGHGLGTARELPQQFVAAAERSVIVRRVRYFELILELDAINDFIRQADALSDVELIAVSVAGAQTLVALARFMQRIEIHDEVKFVVRAV